MAYVGALAASRSVTAAAVTLPLLSPRTSVFWEIWQPKITAPGRALMRTGWWDESWEMLGYERGGESVKLSLAVAL